MDIDISVEHKQNSECFTKADVALGSIALARIIAEVRAAENPPVTLAGAYNRTYNRHNR